MNRTFLLALFAMSLGHAAEPADTEQACPGALAWKAAHPEQSEQAIDARDAARTLTHPLLRKELALRAARDQYWRKEWLNSQSRQAMRNASLVDQDNLAWLRDLVREQGFPTAQQVGERGVGHAWLLAHHADTDPRFRASLLPVLQKRHADGELGGDDLARFTDRVRVAQSLPQWYGTQMPPEKWLTANYGLPDAQSVRDTEGRRKALGIMPLADYVCMMVVARTGKAPPAQAVAPDR